MGNKIREFMTHRGPNEYVEYKWTERDEDSLIGTVRAGQRPVPRIRVFDLLPREVKPGDRSQALVWKGSTLRITAEHIEGRESEFTRAADYDLILLQFCGSSTIESEYGVTELEPGEVVLVPAGISHRSVGKNECLRLRVIVNDMVQLKVDPDKPLANTRFKVIHSDPLSSVRGERAPTPNGDHALEHVSFWDDASDIWIERKCSELVGCVKEGPGGWEWTKKGGRGMRKIRAFDYFTGVTGKGGARAPDLYKSDEFRIDVYNLEGQQGGFHRGCDEDEILFQFRGHGVNENEWGIVELDPGEMSYVPRGIAHRNIGGEGFLRMVFYARESTYPVAFNSLPGRQTSFSVE